jgi:hypothetical protein
MLHMGILLLKEKDRRMRWKSFFFTFLLVFAFSALYSQKSVQSDTSKIIERSFNTNSLQKIREDKDFQYDHYKEPPKSIWDRFWSWFWWKVDQIMRTRQGRTTVWTIIILLSITAIVFFILKVMGMNKVGLFGRTSNSGLPYNVSSDDINNISFDEAIDQAISERNFRLALRLLYLQSLKKLSDKGYIEWQINKTNSDYIIEVVNKPWHSLFKSLTRKFEYTWYGEMNIGKEDFENLQLQFQQFNNQL